MGPGTGPGEMLPLGFISARPPVAGPGRRWLALALAGTGGRSGPGRWWLALAGGLGRAAGLRLAANLRGGDLWGSGRLHAARWGPLLLRHH